MRRFFIPPDTDISDEIILSVQESHHIARVLRLGIGATLQLLDGRGNIHDVEITGMGRRLTLKLLSSVQIKRDDIPLRVCQSVLKGQNMELLMQKCTELGVTEFTPYYSERCQLKKTEFAKLSSKYDRWQRIIEEACKQCNNPIKMELKPFLSFEEMLTGQESSVQKILFWEEEKQKNSLHSHPVQTDKNGLQIVLGPEGGFPASEVQSAKQAGFTILSLGPRILKAETANIAAVSIIQHLLGNM